LREIRSAGSARGDGHKSVCSRPVPTHHKKRKEGYAVATVTNRIAEVISAYRLAGLEPPKLRHLSREEADNVRSGFFSATEFDAVNEQMPEEGLRDFCRFGHLTGWRFGSITKLGWKDIEDGEINLPGRFTKNGEPLKMPLFGDLAELIARREQAKVVKTPEGARISDLVFHRDGKPNRGSGWSGSTPASGRGREGSPARSAGNAAKI